MRLNKEQALAILGSRKMIAAPGKYSVKVTSVTAYEDRMICNFAAMTPGHINGWESPETGEQVLGARALLQAGEYDAACNLTLSSGQRVGRDYVPSKGEVVDIEVDQVTTSNGVTGLFVTSVVARKAVSATSVTPTSWLEDEEEEAEEEEAEEDVFNISKAAKADLQKFLKDNGYTAADLKGLAVPALRKEAKAVQNA